MHDHVFTASRQHKQRYDNRADLFTYHWYRRRYLFCCQAWDLRGSAGGAPLSNFRDGFTVSSSMGTSPRMADFAQGNYFARNFDRARSVLGAVDATSKLRDSHVSNNIAPLCSPSETLAAFQFRFTMAFSSFVVQTTDTAPTASVPGNTTVSPASVACPRRHRCVHRSQGAPSTIRFSLLP